MLTQVFGKRFSKGRKKEVRGQNSEVRDGKLSISNYWGLVDFSSGGCGAGKKKGPAPALAKIFLFAFALF